MKKVISLFLVFALVFSLACVSGFGACAQDGVYSPGDVNSDGAVNSGDALTVLQFSVGAASLSDAQKSAADLNRDGVLNAADALILLEISVGQCLNYGNYPTLDFAWMVNAEKNYKAFAAETAADSSLIPIIASSDHHGLVTEDCEVFKFINDLVDWNGISKIINLGDTVTKTHNLDELKAYSKAMETVPSEKRLEVYGNHDGHSTIFRFNMDKYFIAPGAERSKNNDAFAVYDPQYNVRYLAIDPMAYPWSYTSGRIKSSQADFIIKELEKEDAGDIVMLAHPYLFSDAIITRDGDTFTGKEYFIGNEKKDTEVRRSFLDMLLARKEKRAGVFKDCDGKKHPYDFTACKTDFLMTLHGHHHLEGYETSNGITEFLFQSFRHSEPNCFYFAYIDRNNKVFKYWKNIPGYTEFEFEIA